MGRRQKTGDVEGRVGGRGGRPGLGQRGTVEEGRGKPLCRPLRGRPRQQSSRTPLLWTLKRNVKTVRPGATGPPSSCLS